MEDGRGAQLRDHCDPEFRNRRRARPLPLHLPPSRRPSLQYCGESDLQLERINVYFNEATGGAFSVSQACHL